MENRKLTPHFSLYELTHTSRRKYLKKNRNITQAQSEKLEDLAKLLECFRVLAGVPLIITSGYRCTELNKAVGGASSSQHVKCEAADFYMKGKIKEEDFIYILRKAVRSTFMFGQLIYEKVGEKRWFHVSLGDPYRNKNRCREIMVYEEGKYIKVKDGEKW
jgi:zinc D-Ala-D-Ala carboxypeptidase